MCSRPSRSWFMGTPILIEYYCNTACSFTNKQIKSNFNRFVRSWSHLLMLLNFLLFLLRCIVGLEYCNSVLHSLPWSRLQLLQSVLLNSAARLICGLGRFDHITPVLIDLHWLSYPSIFLTRSVCLCSSVWKVWPRPILLISVLALRLFWVVLVWILQFKVILWCQDTGRSGIQSRLLWLVGINRRLDSEICQSVPRNLLDIWKHTCSELVFLTRHAVLSLY